MLLPEIQWPLPSYETAARLQELGEKLRRSLNSMDNLRNIELEKLPASIIESISGTRKVYLLRHVIIPGTEFLGSRDEANLIQAYMEEFWLPVMRATKNRRIVLCFEFILPISGGWHFFSKASNAARRVSKCLRVLRKIEGADTCQVLKLPKLKSLSINEIEHCITKYLGNNTPPQEQVKRNATSIFNRTENGSYEDVINQIKQLRSEIVHN